jgi:hypothetical protein
MLQEQRDPVRFDNKFGRFLPSHRLNMDSSPLPFVVEQNITVEERGAKSVHILDPSSGAFAKRFATIQVFVSADQRVQPKAAIIFRGTGARISKLEKAAWDPRVGFIFVALRLSKFGIPLRA